MFPSLLPALWRSRKCSQFIYFSLFACYSPAEPTEDGGSGNRSVRVRELTSSRCSYC